MPELTTDYKLPFELIDDSAPLKILDCLFSNYEIPLSESDICDDAQITGDKVGLILDSFLQDKIITREKIDQEIVFSANFNSPKTMGLFQYYRAVLDENLERLAPYSP